MPGPGSVPHPSPGSWPHSWEVTVLSYETYLGFKAYVDRLTDQDGPVEQDYFSLTEWLFRLNREGTVKEDVKKIFPKILWEPDPSTGRSLFNRIFNARRVVGTYDIMEDLYTQHINPLLTPLEQRWDKFIQSQVSAVAVRDRAEKLHSILSSSAMETSMLDVACGSGMGADIASQFQVSQTRCRYVGADIDAGAIKFCEDQYCFLPNICFTKLSIQQLLPSHLGTFDLVWCAGLFDYFFSDLAFINAARRLLRMAHGQVVIGNMGPANLSIPMMNLLGWTLCYRSKQDLQELALRLRGSWENAFKTFAITSDPTGIQHYLHFYK